MDGTKKLYNLSGRTFEKNNSNCSNCLLFLCVFVPVYASNNEDFMQQHKITTLMLFQQPILKMERSLALVLRSIHLTMSMRLVQMEKCLLHISA